MVIREETPITLVEVASLVGDSERVENIKKFNKKFNKMTAEEAKEIKAELRALDLIKLKERYIVKIIDFMPQDTSELNKVIIDVPFNQEESTKILNVIKKY
tara:strand:- start:20007 stop:20309 length:303 start_codon:yes stop_codon:yes gene_type:complete